MSAPPEKPNAQAGELGAGWDRLVKTTNNDDKSLARADTPDNKTRGWLVENIRDVA